MKVSIITTCFNRQGTIADTIESVLRQEYPDIEYILIDGNSQDNSVNIIRRYQDQISTFISEPDNGMYEAINKGIRIATGDIIGLTHSDDILYDSLVIKEVVEKFQETGADLVYGNGLYVSPDNLDRKVRCWRSGRYSRAKVRMGWLPLHTTVYIRRDFMLEHGLYDESFRIASDTDLLIRYLYRKDIRVAFLDRYTVIMRMGGLSTNKQHRRLMYCEDIKIFKRYKLYPYNLFKLMKMAWKVPQYIEALIMNIMF